ncbi:MAG: type 4a pilus biogenesis protein PilO [Microbacterium sp.]|uniref:type 4a pilus biogenesis protein PilO n=1 Tax=Microbacterium sp. TaxID=51671 RepID=UPI00271A675F|nr:type 4a pilus biogenesis protein PilO [Microbacterium sp.]MDO8383367.1 type 4a pilus biogenesis protein PilO [Microbacterium sp.]
MSILRLWVIGSAFVAVLILLAGWFLGVQPRLAEASAAGAERQSVATSNAQYEAVLVELRELSENLPALQSDLDAIRVEIPQEPELPDLLGQLNELAVASGVTLNEVTTDPPQLVPAALLEPLGVTDLVGIPVRVSALGPPEGLAQFMKAAQFGPRLMWVGRFSTGDDADTGRVTLEGIIFVLPEEGAALPMAEEGADPSAAPSAEPSASPSP